MIRKLLLIAFAVCAYGTLSAQTSAPRDNQQSGVEQFWGTWELRSVTQKVIKDGSEIGSQSFTKESILKESNLPEELFLTFYAFDNNIGVCSTGRAGNTRSMRGASSENQFLDINTKGTFAVNGDRFIVKLNKPKGNDVEVELTLDFTYQIKGDELTLSINQPSTELAGVSYRRSLVFLLTSKN